MANAQVKAVTPVTTPKPKSEKQIALETQRAQLKAQRKAETAEAAVIRNLKIAVKLLISSVALSQDGHKTVLIDAADKARNIHNALVKAQVEKRLIA